MQKNQFGHHPTTHENQLVKYDTGPNGHHPVAEAEVDGIQMGVLNDGTPYLAARGLARMCGIDHAPLLRLANNWGEEALKPRGKKITSLLRDQGHPGDLLFTRIMGAYGETNAFPDTVCMALLEYYAFEAGVHCNNTAVKNYRLLARKSFRDFIYDQCNYRPENVAPNLWQPFIDRVSLLHNTVPAGYFGIFHVIQELFVTLGQNGIHSDKSFLPDISVGLAWSAYWKRINGDEKFGARIKYNHNYPSSYPQSESNPQEPWAYPEMALGVFSRWFREKYIANGKLESYLKNRSRKKLLPLNFVNKALLAFNPSSNDTHKPIKEQKRA